MDLNSNNINFPKIGKMAPNFLTVGVYKNQLGKFRLSDYRGKKYVILIFYPANFTYFSFSELLSLNDQVHKFQKLSTQILAISIDTPFSHMQFLSLKPKQGGLNQLSFPLISDLTHTITSNYKLLTEDGLSFPGLFLIDKEGIIQYYTVNNLLCGRDLNELIEILKSIQYIKKNPGQICPNTLKKTHQIAYPYLLKSK